MKDIIERLNRIIESNHTNKIIKSSLRELVKDLEKLPVDKPKKGTKKDGGQNVRNSDPEEGSS